MRLMTNASPRSLRWSFWMASRSSTRSLAVRWKWTCFSPSPSRLLMPSMPPLLKASSAATSSLRISSHQARPCQDSRFRTGQGDLEREFVEWRCGDDAHLRSVDQSGVHAGHGGVYVAGAGEGEGPGRAHGFVFLRGCAVRDGYGQASVRWIECGGDLRSDPTPGTAPADTSTGSGPRWRS